MLSIVTSLLFWFAGWFAKDASILRRVGHVVLQLPLCEPRKPRKVIIADDCFQLSKIPATRLTQVVVKSAEKIFGSMYLFLAFTFIGHYLSIFNFTFSSGKKLVFSSVINVIL